VLVSPLRHRLTAVVLIITAVAATYPADDASGLPVLRVGTSGDYRPFSFHDRAGMLTGFDIVVGQRLAHDLGRRIEFVSFRWSDLVAAQRAGAFDLAMSGITVRADRAVHLAFTRPYAITGAVVAIRVRDRNRFRHTADLDHTGMRVAVNAGGHLEQVARQRFRHAHVLAVADNASLLTLLRHGNAEAVVSDTSEARTWPATQVSTLAPFTHDRKAYALPRESTDLLDAVNEWLAARERDGWLNRQRRRWFGSGEVWTPAQACIEALVAATDLRLQLMPLVAAVKRREHLPIEDPGQEARVLERAREQGAAAGLNQDDVAALFRAQMEAAKAVEAHAPAEDAAGEWTLEDLRAAVAVVSNQLIAELARCQQWVHGPQAGARLDAAMRTGLTAPGLPPALVARLADALHRVRRTPRQSLPSQSSWVAGPPTTNLDRGVRTF
jgi:chorismate mutase-like protein